jgi:molybdenum cofactor synthesis domain-containing protein
VRIAVLTVSDRSFAGERPDASGPQLQARARALGATVVRQAIVPDEAAHVEAVLIDWADSGEVDLILTTGGTGFAPRDRTPEATSRVIDRPAPGLAEAMRAAGMRSTAHAMLSRGVAGLRGRCLIVNLPGSPKAALDSLAAIEAVLPHAVALLQDSADAETGHTPQTRPKRA